MASYRQPLISSHSDTGEGKEPASSSPQKDKPARVSAAAAAVADADEADEDAPASAGITTSLIDKRAASNVSLDSYDRTKNPFFAV